MSHRWAQSLIVLWGCLHATAAVRDTPFRQDVSIRFTLAPELAGASLQKLALNRDGIVYVLADRGVARLFDQTLALDKSFRPLTGLRALDLALSRGELFYLYPDRFLANGWAGTVLQHLPSEVFDRFAVADDGSVLLAGATNLALFAKEKLCSVQGPRREGRVSRLLASENHFFVLAPDGIHRLNGTQLRPFHSVADATALAFRGHELFVGTRQGFFALDRETGGETRPLQTRLPVLDITCLAPAADGLWVGTTRGAYHWHTNGSFRYYASQRWLADDAVIDLQPDGRGDVYVLTRSGLNKIEFRSMTLADKAAHYERKIRQRHIRFGFCAELRLLRAGDITSAEMIDTDNDGTWSNYYMASQAFHFGATGDRQAWSNAWETFAAMERLEQINGLAGFPSRTFERKGFKYSDPDRWRSTADGDWEWKATTSSDEIAAHTFGCAVLWECVARTSAEKQRIASFYDKVMSHIVRNNYYLIDWDGKPTLWGRWNPEYVNWYPHSIGDRRLNSAEIIAGLQLAYRMTRKDLYRARAFELLHQHGYLDNITSSLRLIAPTPGYVHQDNDMGNEWNHSDDLLAFVTYWTLHRYAFDGRLRAKYGEAIKDHVEIEKQERCPLWSFVYASTGAKDFDLEGALWTLRGFPLDLISWTVQNSHRKDVTRLPPNFRHQRMAELLPPGERRISRWNGHPFVLDGGNGGRTEFAGDEFLLPYWMARYLKVIR
jgi:hypothetical protein